jgi:GPI ethanolamine phosphate transferase 2/3 subunit F
MNRHALISEKKLSTSAKESQSSFQSSPSTPIDALDDSLAHIYANIHPLLVLSIYFFRFNYIVEDPITSLLNGLAPLGILQIVYVVLCLPPAGSSNAAPKTPAKSVKGKKTQAIKSHGSTASRTVVCDAVLTIVQHC